VVCGDGSFLHRAESSTPASYIALLPGVDVDGGSLRGRVTVPRAGGQGRAEGERYARARVCVCVCVRGDRLAAHYTLGGEDRCVLACAVCVDVEERDLPA